MLSLVPWNHRGPLPEGCAPQAMMAEALGLTTARLNALLKDKIGLFSLDALVNIATRAGLSVRLLVK
ncbi:MAG: XRE family transcriptional regulator [Betaproteobacteria bacterium]|nr:XRE family transcriptional regulator [Betaproteobacteria bacterium]